MPTQIVRRQIQDAAINDAKIGSDAAIATNKLADGANFISRDGSIPFTGNQSVGNQKLTNLGTPTAAGDAANKSYVDTLIANTKNLFDAKDSVRAATTAAGTLASSFANGSVIDGVTLATADRILIKNQASASENGIYTVNASGAPTRAVDFDAWNEIPGGLVAVEEGTTNADTIWLSTANQGGTLGTTNIPFQQIGAVTGLSNSSFVDKEVPTGAINGSNTAFTLAFTPVTGSEHGYLNGLLQESGSGNDYTISGTSITYTVAPQTGDKLRFSYRKA